MPDGTRYSRTLATKMDAEAWLAAERALVDREEWTPPRARQVAESKRQSAAAWNTVGSFAERYLVERGLRPTTQRNYRQLLRSRILPYFGEMPLTEVTLSEIKQWRASLDPATESSNAAAYRLVRSILQAAEEEELIVRAPPKIRGAGSARVKRVAVPATFDELAVIIDAMPERLRLLIVLAAFVGLREGELLELRRSDVDGVTGRINVTRKVDKDVIPGTAGACPDCGRVISAPKTSQRRPHRPRPAAVPADAAEAPARAHRRGPDGTAVPRRPHRPHERALPDGPLPPGPRGGRPPGPDDPPPAPHRPDPRRPARRHGRRAPGARRPRLPGRDGDLPARHARPRQVARGEDRRDVRRLAREPTGVLRPAAGQVATRISPIHVTSTQMESTSTGLNAGGETRSGPAPA